jgi:hypothetical protein
MSEQPDLLKIYESLFGKKPEETPTASGISSIFGSASLLPPESAGINLLSSLMSPLPSPPANPLGGLGRLFPSATPDVPPAKFPAFPIPGIFSPAVTQTPTGGIWFARTNGDRVRFSEPLSFPTRFLVPVAGLYAILVPDGSATPRPFRPIYFGEAEDLSQRVTRSHEKYDEWCKAASGATNLRLALCYMSRSTKQERTTVESGIVQHYKPCCNVVFNPLASLFAGLSRT